MLEEANAQLIAASPDMDNIIREIKRLWINGTIGYIPVETLVAIDRVIAKIDGNPLDYK